MEVQFVFRYRFHQTWDCIWPLVRHHLQGWFSQSHPGEAWRVLPKQGGSSCRTGKKPIYLVFKMDIKIFDQVFFGGVLVTNEDVNSTFPKNTNISLLSYWRFPQSCWILLEGSSPKKIVGRHQFLYTLEVPKMDRSLQKSCFVDVSNCLYVFFLTFAGSSV